MYHRPRRKAAHMTLGASVRRAVSYPSERTDARLSRPTRPLTLATGERCRFLGSSAGFPDDARQQFDRTMDRARGRHCMRGGWRLVIGVPAAVMDNFLDT
jgi:hypothetical protein